MDVLKDVTEYFEEQLGESILTRSQALRTFLFLFVWFDPIHLSPPKLIDRTPPMVHDDLQQRH